MLKTIYATLQKVETLKDGTLIVYGYASSENRDSEGEMIKADAMRKALPEYMRFGAVREMHQPKAAGKAIEASVQDNGHTWFGAHIVDREAIEKVRTDVYKGFSLGGKVTNRDSEDPSVITGLQLLEISLVDRPSNPEAVFTMFKQHEDCKDPEELLEKLKQALNLARREIIDLRKQVTELSALPDHPKARLRTIDKTQDINDANSLANDIQPVKNATGGIDEAATAIKRIHQSGGFMLHF